MGTAGDVNGDGYDDVIIGYPRSAFDLAGKPKWVEERLDTWHGIYGPIYGFREEFPDRSAAAGHPAVLADLAGAGWPPLLVVLGERAVVVGSA